MSPLFSLYFHLTIMCIELLGCFLGRGQSNILKIHLAAGEKLGGGGYWILG